MLPILAATESFPVNAAGIVVLIAGLLITGAWLVQLYR